MLPNEERGEAGCAVVVELEAKMTMLRRREKMKVMLWTKSTEEIRYRQQFLHW